MNGEYISLDTAKKLENKERAVNILLSRIAKLEYEVERLNNIINELFEYLKENSKQPELFESDRYYENVLDKLQELLGSDKE